MLAIGTLSGQMHIYDAHTLQLQHSYNNAHTQRIAALAWNTHVPSSGSRDRIVHYWDVREASLARLNDVQGTDKKCVG